MYEIKYRNENDLKDSGVEWLGNIPKSYGVISAKYLASIKTGSRDTQDRVDDGQYPFYVRSKNIEKIDTYSFDEEAILTPGDGDIGGIFHYVNGKFDYHQRVYKYSNFKDCNCKYLYYYLMIFLKRKVIGLSAKSTVDSLRLPMLLNFECVLCSLLEQQKIANFLDIKTAQFDNIIEKKEQLIEKLQEAKKSLIFEVVTGKMKIIDGKMAPRDASEMLDSGIEEFGFIACDYRVSKIKFHGDFKAGISKSADYFGKGYPFVNYPDVYKNEELVMGSGLAITSKKERIDFSINKGDVFFTRTSETIDDIGESSICKTNIANGSYSGFIIRYRVWDKSKVDYNYSKYYFQNINIKKWFARQLNIVTRASLSQDKLKELPFILPSYEEQKNIGLFLEYKVNQIDSTIHKTFEQIEKLKQAKQSLISEAVTGKIDLRDWEIIEEGEFQ